MSPTKLPAEPLEQLVRKNLSAEEDESTTKLIRRMRGAKKRGYLTASELVAVCRWKSPRAIRFIRSNLPADIRRATRSALATRSERARMESLLTLEGVAVPTASAILMLLDPKRYGVIDIRSWQTLYESGEVDENPRGTGLTVENWVRYVLILRRFAKTFRVSARDIGRTLFDLHREHQVGRLYGNSR